MDRHRPHATGKSKETCRLILAYRNMAGIKGISHVGLGINALNTSRVLRSLGYWVDVWPCNNVAEIRTKIAATNQQAMKDHQHPISTVVVAAPWISSTEMQSMITAFPDINFACICHSNIGFLMADPQGIKLFREYTNIQTGSHNFNIAGNCSHFTTAWQGMYGVPCLTLPNLYDVSTIKNVGQRTPYKAGTLNVGIFGAERPLKNMVTAVAAAIELGNRMHVPVDIYMSSGRTENGGGTVSSAIDQFTNGLMNVKVIRTGWQSWPEFRQTVSKMHVVFNISYTESFNLVTADAIAEGVASVCSEAISWVPPDWIANSDNASDVATVASRLLYDTHAVTNGQLSLRNYVKTGIPLWTNYLGE